MYKSEYNISGMTCQGCVSSIKNKIETDDRVISVKIDLQSSNLNLESIKDITLEDLNFIIRDLKKYSISYPSNFTKKNDNISRSKKLSPLIISLLIVLILATIPQIRHSFSLDDFMKYLMGYFFVIFSLFKLINVKGFATSFSNYDIIASRVTTYGKLYPFIELFLGICFLLGYLLLYVNILTFFIMSIGSIGIWNALRNNNQLECACLGSSLSLPLTPVTLAENLIMAIMALYMIIKLM